MFRNIAKLALNASLLAVLPIVAFAQQPPAAPAAPAPAPADPNAAAAAAAAAQQFSINQNVGDWVVRCVLTTVKSPAPCEVLQSTVNKDNQQRISSMSIAYVPSRETYAMQIVVPTGVALAKGLTLAPALNAAGSVLALRVSTRSAFGVALLTRVTRSPPAVESRAIQYAVPPITFCVGIATVFHAPLCAPEREPCAMSDPGAPPPSE